MEFRILGPLEVWDGGQPIAIAGVKRRALLALLVVRANEVVRTERLIDELWGERPPVNAAAALHNHVSRLRRVLGPEVLVRREWGYALRTPPESIDLRVFERQVLEADPLPAKERAASLAQALALWRGGALSDLALEPALQREIARLDELHIGTIERRIDADLEAGRNSELIGELETLIAEHPLREHLRSQLILALYRAGRQADALEVYRETRRVLADELGLEPSPELRELEKAILRQDPSLVGSTSLPPAPVLASVPPPMPPASKRRRWLVGGIAGAVLITSGVVAAAALIVASDSRNDHVSQPPPPVSAHGSDVTTTVRIVVVHQRRPARRGHRLAATKLSAPTTTAATAITTVTTQAVVAVPSPSLVAHSAHHSTKRVVNHRRAATKPPPTKIVSTAQRPTSPPPPKYFTIADTFRGTQIDGTIWYQIYQGSGWTLSEHDGHLEFLFPPSSTPGGQWDNFGGHVGTLCQFPGNFDAQVDFDLSSWPAANGMAISLWAWLGPENTGYEAWRASSTSDNGGEQYGSYTGRSVGVSLNDTAGTLRIARKNGLITAYFLHNGRWQPLTSGRDSETAKIAVGVQSARAAGLASTVAVDFTNFKVLAANPICPTGAQPPSS